MEDMEAEVYVSFLEGLTPGLVRTLQEAGYLVDGSVVNDAERLRTALELSVDFIESDRPEEIIRILEEQYAGQLSHTYPVVPSRNRGD